MVENDRNDKRSYQMKIIIVGTAFPYRGGLAAYNERLALEYVKQGHEVEIYTFTLQYPSFLFPGKTQFSTDPAPTELTILRRVNSVNPFNWIKVGREIKKKNPDLWLRFLKIYRKHNVRFIWIKGHSSIPENERCDQLAVESSKNSCLLDDTGYCPEEADSKLFN